MGAASGEGLGNAPRNGGIVPPNRRGDLPTGNRPPLPLPPSHRLGATAGLGYLPAFSRCTVMPTIPYWNDRQYDITAAIRRLARNSYIPVTPFPLDANSVTGTTMMASGWRSYGFVVPPGGQVLLKLEHPKPGWFRVFWMDKWGDYRPGMMVKPGEPQALYINKGKEPMAVYAIVDDPGQWATTLSPFTLVATRNYDPAHFDAHGMSVQQGIWNTAAESYWMSAAHP